MAKGTFAKAMPPVSSEEDGYVDRPKEPAARRIWASRSLRCPPGGAKGIESRGEGSGQIQSNGYLP